LAERGSAELARELDLSLTLFPSLFYPFVELRGSEARVVAGKLRGLSLRVEGRKLFYEGANFEAALLVSGAWFDPFEVASKLPKSARSRAWPVVEAYGSLGLAVDPYDKELVFASAFLSRTTDFHANTARWCRKLVELSPSLRGVTPELAKLVGSSYHLSQLPRALERYFAEVLPLEEGGAAEARVKEALMRIEHVGPKTALAYLLFTRPSASRFAPPDTHFKALAERLGLLEDAAQPSKAACSKHDCASCPLASRCLSGLAQKEYGALAGWLQTACYIHGKLRCRRRLCSSCELRSICSSPFNST